jgi:hypothetical protein
MRSPIHPEVNLQLREIEPGRFSCSLAVRTTGERCSSREFNMNKNSNAELGLRLIAVPLLIALAIGCLGCQTFSLTNEQWEKQQRGELVDRDVGAAVDILGTLGWYGASIGSVTARSFK